MSGRGQRFIDAGYGVPKPMIMVDEKPMISHVVDLFPGEQCVTFICRESHLNDPSLKMQEQLLGCCATAKIISIPEHKLGPIHAVLSAAETIDQNKQTIVNYCDFSCYWDWENFKHFVSADHIDGAIPCYRAFHPHSLGNTKYAYVKETNGDITDIQEKKPFTKTPTNEFASTGTYYFSSGKLMLDAFEQTITDDLSVGGEFYVSLAYKYLLANDYPVKVYPIEHFMQWGTPEDLEEYAEWSDLFRYIITKESKPGKPQGTTIVPMAGKGKRFLDEGYNTTKPLIEIFEKPMVIQAASTLPTAEKQIFVMRKGMKGLEHIIKSLEEIYSDLLIEIVPEPTEGQACTALAGFNAAKLRSDKLPCPITIGACDTAFLYDQVKFQSLIEDPVLDVIVWAAKSNAVARRHPKMFGWIDMDRHGIIRKVSVKEPLTCPKTDLVVTGTFTFNSPDVFENSVNALLRNNNRVNGEFYLDSCINEAINLGYNCKIFPVDHCISWGTPSELRTFDYWKSCFQKWEGHPYSNEKL